ncbi:MAG TPA: TlpA disulfide reductase family protein [Steroidobacteraceae bacterium]|nr:TlpA disulfide reductase family protein [Steroidobacteraceae bacterium]
MRTAFTDAREWHVCRVAFALVVAGLGVAACSKPASKDLQPGSYRAVLELPGGKALPFGLDVAREENGPVLYLINGTERVRVTEVSTEPGTLGARMPGYETTLEATVEGGELAGTVRLVHDRGRVLELPFEAKLGETWRFHAEPLSDNADVAGRWQMVFTDESGRRVRGVAELQQQFEQVTGTVILPTGDQRFLAGDVRDETLQLSRFDGGAAVLYEAKLDTKGNLVGETWSDRGGRQRFVATRDPDAEVESSAAATELRNPDAEFAFSFPDLAARAVSTSDPTFDGRVLLVSITGSWCPNAHDEARLLADLDRRYRSRGLAIVALMFEQHDDPARAVAAIRRFRDATGIDYPTLLAGGADKAKAAAALPQLEAVRAYPTTVFIDRAGRVRRIQAGFIGPAAEVHHAQLVHEYEQTVEDLLLEPAPDPANPGSS